MSIFQESDGDREINCTCDDFGLSEHNLLCDASLPLVQLLTNAGDHTQAILQSVGRFLANELSQHTRKSFTTALCTVTPSSQTDQMNLPCFTIFCQGYRQKEMCAIKTLHLLTL